MGSEGTLRSTCTGREGEGGNHELSRQILFSGTGWCPGSRNRMGSHIGLPGTVPGPYEKEELLITVCIVKELGII